MSKYYVHDLPDWPDIFYSHSQLVHSLASVRLAQGRLIGKLEALGFQLRSEETLKNLSNDVLKSSEIEGMFLRPDQVRSSVARKLGLPSAGLKKPDRNIDGFVEILLDATQNYRKPLSIQRLHRWHTLLFPTGHSGLQKIEIGTWRKDKTGPMQVVSGRLDKPRVHFVAPAARKIEREMKFFLQWFNATQEIDPIIKSGMAHFWFVTIHPYEDGNGRIARVIGDMQLARSEENPHRFYSLSSRLAEKRKEYYVKLEKSQCGSLDLTDWLLWYTRILLEAIAESEAGLKDTARKARFWETHEMLAINARQRAMLNRLFDGFQGKLTSSKWAAAAKCSQDTAIRDIQALIELRILKQEKAGGRSTNYVLIA